MKLISCLKFDVVKFEKIEDELVGEDCVQPFRTYETHKTCYDLCKKCSI